MKAFVKIMIAFAVMITAAGCSKHDARSEENIMHEERTIRVRRVGHTMIRQSDGK